MPTVEKVARTDTGLASALRISVMRLSRRMRSERDPDNELLPVGQLSVLGSLFRNGECTVGELAALERVQPPSMTRTIACLVEGGYVVRHRHATDGRQVVVALSESGRETVAADRRRRRLARAAAARPHPRRTRPAAAGRPAHRKAGRRLSPTFRSLSNRNYRLYASGAVVSNVGTWMQRVAQDWLVLQLSHGSGTALGITTGLQFLPILLLSPYAGLIADRFPKRRLLQVTQLMLAVPALVLGLLAVTGVAQTWQVFVLAFVFGIGSAFDAPARQSFVSEIVGPDDLTNAVGLNSASFNLARMIGPALAGVLIAAFGSGVPATGAVILVNAVSYGAVIISLQRMRERDLMPATREKRHPGMIREGVRYTLPRPDLMLILTIVFFAGTFGLNFQITSALMATEVFDKGAGEYGLLGTTLAIGSLSGALLAARRVRIRHRLVILAGARPSGVAEIVAGLLPSYLTFAIWTPVLGMASLTLITSANATFQMSVAPAMRGRVMALYMMVFMGGTPVGAPIIGWVGETFGPRWTLLGGGADDHRRHPVRGGGLQPGPGLAGTSHERWPRGPRCAGRSRPGGRVVPVGGRRLHAPC